MDTSNTRLHGRYLSYLGYRQLNKERRITLVAWAQSSPLSEMMRSCKFFPHGELNMKEGKHLLSILMIYIKLCPRG